MPVDVDFPDPDFSAILTDMDAKLQLFGVGLHADGDALDQHLHDMHTHARGKRLDAAGEKVATGRAHVRASGDLAFATAKAWSGMKDAANTYNATAPKQAEALAAKAHADEAKRRMMQTAASSDAPDAFAAAEAELYRIRSARDAAFAELRDADQRIMGQLQTSVANVPPPGGGMQESPTLPAPAPSAPPSPGSARPGARSGSPQPAPSPQPSQQPSPSQPMRPAAAAAQPPAGGQQPAPAPQPAAPTASPTVSPPSTRRGTDVDDGTGTHAAPVPVGVGSGGTPVVPAAVTTPPTTGSSYDGGRTATGGARVNLSAAQPQQERQTAPGGVPAAQQPGAMPPMGGMPVAPRPGRSQRQAPQIEQQSEANKAMGINWADGTVRGGTILRGDQDDETLEKRAV